MTYRLKNNTTEVVEPSVISCSANTYQTTPFVANSSYLAISHSTTPFYDWHKTGYKWLQRFARMDTELVLLF